MREGVHIGIDVAGFEIGKIESNEPNLRKEKKKTVEEYRDINNRTILNINFYYVRASIIRDWFTLSIWSSLS